MSGENDWRWIDANGVQNPITKESLREGLASGAIPTTALVWAPGWNDWKPAQDVLELGISPSFPKTAKGLRAGIQTSADASPRPRGPLPSSLGDPDAWDTTSRDAQVKPPSKTVKTHKQTLLGVAPALPPENKSPTLGPSVIPPVAGPSVGAPSVGAPSVIGSSPNGLSPIRGSSYSPSGPLTPRWPRPGQTEAPRPSLRDPVSFPPMRAAEPHDNVNELDDETTARHGALTPSLGARLSQSSAAARHSQRAPVSLSDDVISDDDDEVIPTFSPLFGRKKRKWVLPAAVGAVFVCIVVVMGWVEGKFASTNVSKHVPPGGDKTEHGTGMATKNVRTSSSGVAAATATTSPKPLAHPAQLAHACKVTGTTQILTPKAMVAVGIETAFKADSLMIGFARSPTEGVVQEVDPSSLAVLHQKVLRKNQPIRRVVPDTSTPGVQKGILETSRKGDALRFRRTVDSQRPFDIGVMNGALAWAPLASVKATPLWPLEGDDPVEALRAARMEKAGAAPEYIVAFRRGGNLWLGWLTAEKAPLGPLVRADTTGEIGAPTLAVHGDAAMIAWAERPHANMPWGIRLLHWTRGHSPTVPTHFTVPAGGLGGDAMSPSLSMAGDKRFLMVWAEGPVSHHQVRGVTLDATGEVVGEAFAISASGVNAGQGQGAVATNGKGGVFYMASTERKFQLMATSIVCGGD